ncbi:MAG: aminotransferase class V-fold PLP-dependent enzyme [Gemmatimonadota bacterium]
MPASGPLRPDVDPHGLMEFSVVFSDRSLNHMSQAFQEVMRDISTMLRQVYNAEAVAVIPGGGTCAMEAVARQFANEGSVLVLRNGWFSYRWSQIFVAGSLTEAETVLKALPVVGGARQGGGTPAASGVGTPTPFSPAPLEEAVARIRQLRPQVVFAPHVETSAGVILPEEYIKALGQAAHEVGALFVLDCIASGCVWVDMKATGVDVLISAPQKGWSSQPCAGLVMLSERARARVKETTSSSFALDLGKWLSITETYEGGGHAYHATLPTDGLTVFRDTMAESMEYGLDRLEAAQWELGQGVRALLAKRGVTSVAAEGFGAPGVVVGYTDDPEVKSGRAFVKAGAQIAAGVPLQCDEPEGFSTFRLGLFGLDKLYDVPATLARLDGVFDEVF